MKKEIIIKGRFFVARSHCDHPFVWSVFDKGEKYVETFGGPEAAARVHVAALDRQHLQQEA